ncbi:MAG: GAF domain-containing sensor histidine kinase [Desulfobacteraceae bacterium]
MANNRDKEKIPVRNGRLLLRIAGSLHLYPDIEDLLAFTTEEIARGLPVEGTAIFLLDEEKNDFFCRAAAFENKQVEKKIKKLRVPGSRGVAGRVVESGEPVMIDSASPHRDFLPETDMIPGYKTVTRLDVPMQVHNRIIGIVSVVNKKQGSFDHQDRELLSALASTIAHPVENARINRELSKSYNEVKSLNRAKDKVIHHLSHELKTPVSVLAASLEIIETKLEKGDTDNFSRVLQRADRNVQRLLEMQYEIEDLLVQKDYTVFHLLSRLFQACKDQLEVLITKELGGKEVLKRIETEITELFGPREADPEKIRLNEFVEETLRTIGFRFADRECRIVKELSFVPDILIPREVLTKIVEGLIKNSVENTPDGGEIRVLVARDPNGVMLAVKDTGVGITEENLNLIFENYFTAYETSGYVSGRPYAFGAGGKGFDLLRMKIFSERFHFTIQIRSTRCPHIVENRFSCPGNIDKCTKCSIPTDCTTTGGTEVTVMFPRNPDHKTVE